MAFNDFKRRKIQIAEETPFDPVNCDQINTDNVQDAIEEICTSLDTSASPGFTWGKSGNVSNSYLLNDTVPSNKAGRRIFLNSATLEAVFVSNQNVGTFDIEIYEHDGTTFTLITTVNVVAARGTEISTGSLALTTGKELAVKVVTGAAKNPVVGCVLKGTF